MNYILFICLFCLITLPFNLSFEGEREDALSFLHKKRLPPQLLSVGWQEPGFWRPVWIVEREFLDGDQVVKRDRKYIKFSYDRSAIFKNPSKRPLFYRQKPKSTFDANRNTSVAFDPLDEESFKNIVNEEFDGAYHLFDEILPVWRHQFETNEGNNKFLHDARITYGKLDPYAVIFSRGRITKYSTFSKNGKTLPGQIPVGFFTMKTNPHRPLVSKEYVAFQY